MFDHLSIFYRYVNGDALRHYESRHDHCVCMDANTTAVFCYSCDEFIINDTKTGRVEGLRKQLSTIR